ncbi:RNA exonuclease 3 [Penicillium canariense]|uniref:RNA exonuclease 3 n=1 Tax=Penicillium canariense TaxID=189055 RepID=A0A9W9IBD8_9EURO|nr:RNA exonuclease 3 [Penicillium canariense]KAJ5174474.1 RNA exonuclease 3 [Penicillium canariense]
MFTTLGLFTEVACPQGEHCSLLTCMFSHKASDSSSANKRSARTTAASKMDNTHPSKKLKTRTDTSSLDDYSISSHETPINIEANSAITATKCWPGYFKTIFNFSGSISATTTLKLEACEWRTFKHHRHPKANNIAAPPRNAPKESLNPRLLTKAPAPHGVRTAILQKLHSTMVSQNEKLAKSKESSNKCFKLTGNELVTMALDEEERVAKDSPDVYSNVIKLRIVKLAKMSTEEWAKEVMEHLNARYYKLPPADPTPKAPKQIETGLTTKQEIVLISKLITPLNGLEEFGYVTKAPTAAEIETARQGVLDSKGWEKCDRCGSRFQVFPGRREDGALTTGGLCIHHNSRPIYPPRKKTDHYTGSADPYFSCCGESVGTSVGCTKSPHHVFKVSEPKRLASILQFEPTPQQPDKGPMDPVCFDCEMGYTTQGLELIRLTAVSWPEGRELLDILVRPIGEVLDLNSRYSGVFPEHYANAIPYGTSSSTSMPHSQGEDKKQQKPMQVVESPAAARKLLFEFLQPDTPLIGHAIDNDLNVCRIIHPTIIDTVILYPAPRGGLPNRQSLKNLARKYLDRDIQTGGDKGHDSKEDSIATGELVRAALGERWKNWRHKGWHFEDNELVPPPSQGLNLAGLEQKRKHTSSP